MIGSGRFVDKTSLRSRGVTQAPQYGPRPKMAKDFQGVVAMLWVNSLGGLHGDKELSLCGGGYIEFMGTPSTHVHAQM